VRLRRKRSCLTIQTVRNLKRKLLWSKTSRLISEISHSVEREVKKLKSDIPEYIKNQLKRKLSRIDLTNY